MQPRRALTVIAALIALFSNFPSALAAQKQLSGAQVPEIIRQQKAAPLGRLPATNELRLALALPLRDAAGLTNLLRELYNPASPQFRRFLAPGEFTKRFGPASSDYAALAHFAKTNGLKITATHPNRLLLDVTGKAADIERAFKVRLNSYRHPSEQRNFFAADTAPTVDARLPLFQVSGLDNFSPPHPKAKLQPANLPADIIPHGGSGPSGSFTGTDLRQAYLPGAPLTGTGQSVALLQFDGFYPIDITNYASAIGITNPPFSVIPVNGGVATPGANNIEVALDIEMVLAMAPGISNIYVYEAPNPSPWVDILSQIANDNFARQVSCSWGGGFTDPAAEMVFLQMAAQGQTFFNASGDSTAFVGAISFPSESPNITQVGGTTLTTDVNGDYVSEKAWNWGGGNGSSGGISPAVPIPVWQLGLPPTTNNASTTMRNIPDVALTGDRIFINYNNGSSGIVGGTSAAAPMWAGFMALANQQAEQSALPPIGFLNPAIYSLARATNYLSVFHDVTTGNNTNAFSPNNYYATDGYDLCTGLGTPLGTNFLNAIVVPEDLRILPASVFISSGLVGGPFTPANRTVTLTNLGNASLDWSLGPLPGWLTISANAGTLAANATTNLTLQLNGAEALGIGEYFASITVTNETSARLQIIAARLDIGQSIVQNGGFETGDFTGWTLFGNTIVGNSVYNIVISDDFFPGVTHSGNFGAFLGQGSFVATLSQNLPTQPGQLYQLSFWLNNPIADTPQIFGAQWDTTNVLLALTNPPVLDWTNYQFLVTATTTNTPLLFFERNDPNYYGLDDVTVTPVPPVAFSTAALTGGNLEMTWNSLAGLNYEVDYTTNLAPVNWQLLQTLTATNNTCGLTETNVQEEQRYYRLILLP